MKIVTEFPRKTVEHPDLGITMPDGTRLSARAWIPEDADENPVPMILEHLPYRKRDGTVQRDAMTHPYLAGHGYACLRVDMRGNGDSEGLMEDEYTAQELQDACDVIAWARAQPWCSGAVGMMGISWGGFNALQVASLNPPGLKAIITLCSTVDRYGDDIHYKGGALLGENLGWAAQMLSYSSRPPDPEIVGNGWRDMWLKRLEAQPFHLSEWLRHQHRDAYWKHGSVCEEYAAIKAAVLSIGGWHDGYRNTISHLVENLDAPVKGIVGPWMHKYPHYAEPKPAIGFLQEALRWWDHWLKGEETGVEDDPAMRMYMMDSVRPAPWLSERPGRWIVEKDWPGEIDRDVLHLTDNGLSEISEPLDRSISSPADCGAMTGEYFPFAFGPEMPLDQRRDDGVSACFDTGGLDSDLDIVGGARVELEITSDKPQGQIAVRLTDVFPDGTSALIAHGFLNLAHRRSHENPEPMIPGETFRVSLDLDHAAYRIPAGHRLRVAISTAYWPFLWPSPEPVQLRLTTGRLILPLRETAKEAEWEFEAPEAAPLWRSEANGGSGMTRRREIDQATGRSVMIITHDDGETTDLDLGLTTSSKTEERWSIVSDDPTSARGDISWEASMRRGEWSVRTASKASLSCDAETFYLTAKLKAWEGDRLVFERDFDDEIARDCL
jgi:putative CocE/NonD family hydrolase